MGSETRVVTIVNPYPKDTAMHRLALNDSAVADGRPTVSAVSTALSHRDVPQLDGPQDYYPQMITSSMHALAAPSRSTVPNTQHQRPKTAYRDLLPYCTVEMPLDDQELVGLSDLAGSLREVMLLALRAKTNGQCQRQLELAVGVDATRGIVDFFADEFEV